ncbi:probable NAD binding Rossmann fold oxidoreductase [Melanopsichium pennsylvanicum]|uniref:D-galacturonic acid reductase n=2 Tax=Melanopsichium pennsylvanicum TaxID=63383 RepID=A0A077QXP4_9BASI|nr:d-galacturonic acid reductase [Melanopsichium pennsylvanicum 4]SNX81488.1 probable NAD binding Rossmann fold oxidoreductase [Melanopsichium pennsylvanicum]
MSGLPTILAVGTGEYTTGFVGGTSSPSDKKLGVVGLVMFDLRRRNLISPEIKMVGTNGDKFQGIRNHFKTNIEAKYREMDTTFTSYPAPGIKDADAYKIAIDSLKVGDAITIFTPDSTHYDIALYAIQRGIHVLVTKPATQTLSDHQKLIKAAQDKGVLCMVEHHKRFDPAYADARQRARDELGDLNYFYSYMSQPKNQLETFKAWAGRDSDISYYLNSHHIDVCLWMTQGRAIPTRVTASASQGIATSKGCVEGTEDTITLLVDFDILDASNGGNKVYGKRATAIFTASWTAPQGAGVHSEQQFHFVGTRGETRINQARRGYQFTLESEQQGLTGGASTDYNPFYMRYTPDAEGYFAGQHGYGYISLENFVVAVTRINKGEKKAQDFDVVLPTIKDTVLTSAILEAGRRSLDLKKTIQIKLDKGEYTLV